MSHGLTLLAQACSDLAAVCLLPTSSKLPAAASREA